MLYVSYSYSDDTITVLLQQLIALTITMCARGERRNADKTTDMFVASRNTNMADGEVCSLMAGERCRV